MVQISSESSDTLIGMLGHSPGTKPSQGLTGVQDLDKLEHEYLKNIVKKMYGPRV